MKDFLVNQSKENNISFHMPGHKGPGIYQKYGYSDFLNRMMDCDITEIPGADNLYQPEGIIRNIEERYKKLYGVKKSHILVNGTSCGIVAAILATVRRGGKLLMSRGCHRSVYSGISLGNITPCYIQPETTKEGLMGVLDHKKVARALDENPEAEAVILPSPNYYGICSDIEKIADEVHKRGKILIVDQAHGAHLHFFEKFCNVTALNNLNQLEQLNQLSQLDQLNQLEQLDQMRLPRAAEDLDADIVINSTHKTLATFTQTAVLNVVTDRVDNFKLESYLHMVQSTSPSYLLMASHDINSKIIEEHGREIFSQWLEDLDWFYGQANKQLINKNTGDCLITRWDRLDFTKINIDASVIGWTGGQMENYLMENKIVPEMVTGNIVVAMSGIGSVRKDYEKLLEVLIDAVNKAGEFAENVHSDLAAKAKGGLAMNESIERASEKYPHIKVVNHGEKVIERPLAECEGFASGDLLIPYPPGIPVLCPGEMVTQEIIDYIEKLTGEDRQVLGLSEEGAIHVYEK